MQGAPSAGPNTEQHFGNAEAADGGFVFQGIVHGDVKINREYRLRANCRTGLSVVIDVF
jgi:hypothetical protein